jgi:hypothetical protein
MYSCSSNVHFCPETIVAKQYAVQLIPQGDYDNPDRLITHKYVMYSYSSNVQFCNSVLKLS